MDMPVRYDHLPQPVMPRVPPQKMLLGQKALVTGASSGIGRAIAQSLADAGAEVVVNYASGMEKAQELVREIQAKGGRALAIKADVSDELQVQSMFRETIDALGTIDILINNAGLQQGVRPEVSCAAGKIICVSSVHEVIPWAGHVNYAASKGGVMLMMKSIAQEVAPLRIRVNSICPGAIRTPINMEAWDTPEHYNALMKLIPYKRIGEVEDIGRAAVWLASDYSDYVHGTSLFIDGGMTLYPGFETGG
jgi:glucose 1-dehydrogenase